MVGSSSTMAMRRDIAGEYSPSGAHPSACHRFARIARRVAIAAPRAAPVLSPQCLPEHRTGGTHETLAAVSGIGRRARRRGRHGARWNRLGARYARVCGAVPMNREHEIALGVECAWTPLPEPRRSSWLWMVFITKLKPGDMLIAERADGRRVTYRVSAMEVLDRREVWVTKQEGPARLTLVTCYPLDAWRAGGSQRYVLVAFLS